MIALYVSKEKHIGVLLDNICNDCMCSCPGNQSCGLRRRKRLIGATLDDKEVFYSMYAFNIALPENNISFLPHFPFLFNHGRFHRHEDSPLYHTI